MIQDARFWLLLAAAVPAYWLLPTWLRAGFLAAVSFGYLVVLAPFSACALLVWGLAFYAVAPAMVWDRPRPRVVLLALVLGVLSFLAWFKYVPPLAAALADGPTEARVLVPLGISYYTFKLIHYAAEVARGHITDRSLPRFLCYLFLFPIFTAGPIERFDHFLEAREQAWRLDSAVAGLMRVACGLIKKLIIADWWLRDLSTLLLEGQPFTALDKLSTGQVWGYLALTFLHVYMDFSGYTDIAIGCSRLFGYRIFENFNWPVAARNIGDFWRRWHRTLAGWAQSYVYMPILGLTRRPLVAVYAAFAVIGLWHEGSMLRLAWGLYHATGVAAFTLWTRQRRRVGWLPRLGPFGMVLAWAMTQAFVVAGMAFLVVKPPGGAHEALRILAKLVGVGLSPRP